MRLNHFNLCVPDVSEASAFFTRHFGLKCINRQGDTLAVLDDNTGFILALSHFSDQPPSYPTDSHLGFHLGSSAEVDAVYGRLQAAGIEVGPSPRKAHGSYGFHFGALDTITLEVAHWLGN